MLVRTGDPHPFDHAEALGQDVYRYTVKPIPHQDHAQRALLQAQADYFTKYPEAKRYASALYWDITENTA